MIVICHWCSSQTNDRYPKCYMCGRNLKVGEFLFEISYPNPWGRSLNEDARENAWAVVAKGLGVEP